MKTLGQRIRERRDELDLSLRELAKLLGCSPPFVSDVEHGRRFPSETMLMEIARVLRLPLEALRQLDPRAPVEDLKRMTEQNPSYAFAFRTMVDKQPTPEELLEFLHSKTTGKPPKK